MLTNEHLLERTGVPGLAGNTERHGRSHVCLRPDSIHAGLADARRPELKPPRHNPQKRFVASLHREGLAQIYGPQALRPEGFFPLRPAYARHQQRPDRRCATLSNRPGTPGRTQRGPDVRPARSACGTGVSPARIRICLIWPRVELLYGAGSAHLGSHGTERARRDRAQRRGACWARAAKPARAAQ